MTEAQRLAVETSESKESTNQVSALDEDDDDIDVLADRVPEDASHLQACITAAQGCLLLLKLKQHIKDVYGLSDRYLLRYMINIEHIHANYIKYLRLSEV